MKSKFNKLFVTILLVVAVTCCGAFGVLAADNTDEAAAAASTTETTETNTDNDHNSSLSIGLVLWQPGWPVSAAAWLLLPLPPLLSLPTARTKRPSVRA